MAPSGGLPRIAEPGSQPFTAVTIHTNAGIPTPERPTYGDMASRIAAARLGTGNYHATWDFRPSYLISTSSIQAARGTSLSTCLANLLLISTRLAAVSWRTPAP